MPFSYYRKLTPAQRRIYDESDRIRGIALYRPESHRERALSLSLALQSGSRPATELAAQALANGLAEAFDVPALRIFVAERRPSWQTGELHGLYQADEKGRFRISLWMRTAQRAQVVKFRTFLRTFLHELCHHLDYHRFGLRDSFHTEGFYRRESSLFKQLFPQELEERTPSGERGRKRLGLRGAPSDV